MESPNLTPSQVEQIAHNVLNQREANNQINMSQIADHSHTGTDARRVSGEDLELSDSVANNASTDMHGFLPKLSGSASDFLRGDGTFGPYTKNLICTMFEATSTNRYSKTFTGTAGGSSGGAGGLDIFTSTVNNNYAEYTYTPIHTSKNIFSGNPLFSTTVYCTQIDPDGGDGSGYFGLGLVTVTGVGHTYTDDHVGFKILKVSSSPGVSTLYATQGDGVTENAQALQAVLSGDAIDLFLSVSGSTVSYSYSVNGAGYTNISLTGNVPNSSSDTIQFSVSNDNTPKNVEFGIASCVYGR